ncbi:methionine--tRNA ligase, cytoplasmic-like [Elysia marginata]|uniref:Methionine--tRNA ligase, cytoplasmic n=1 Tax=Elysia marginata TaxID=1093978 RepID=A0AAV4G7N9_9GAST|nr:methionine--tRNA ligase, cytoplasmic-like [Elysia marginata]
MKVFTDPGNFQTPKIEIAAQLTNTKLELVTVKHNEFIAPFSSSSKLPVLEVKEGVHLFSPNTAAKYLFLKANKIQDEDAENAFLDWECSQLLPPMAAYLLGQGRKDQTVTKSLAAALQHLDSSLAKTKYLTGETVSVSDICVFCTLAPLLGQKNCDLLRERVNVQRWCQEMSNNAVVKPVLDNFTASATAQEDFKASLSSQTFTNVSAPSNREKPAVEKSSPSKSCVASEDQVSTYQCLFRYKNRGFYPLSPTLNADNARQELWYSPLSPTLNTDNARQESCLPKSNARNILVTSALPYVNNVPHLGNIIGCVLSGDVFSRFARLRNYNVLYVSGTDEYGTATETKAMEEGVTPQEICDKFNKLHNQIYRWFNIDFDMFGRTTTKQQTKIAQDIFWKLYERGFILKDSIDQLKCTKCDKFLADRFVEGQCPLCSFDDARGDQCDGCGKLLNAIDLINPKCKMCKGSPIIVNSQHLFVDLPKLEPMLKSHLDSVFDSGTWTHNARVITNSWIRDGLKPRCISRDLKWGTPVPLEGYQDKVFYVWFDAPIGYLSITANYTDQWERWWKNPEQVEMYNFLGKDNVPFHSVIFPSCLLGTNDGYSVVNNMVATEYLNYEDTKFSKSRNTGVFGDQAETTGIPADVYRFYLLYLRPESQDTAFSWDDFMLKNNSELLNNLGNFINRALTFLFNIFGGEIQEMVLSEDDKRLVALVTKELQTYVNNLEACRLRDGIRNILMISKLGNQFMQANKPWVLAKGSPEENFFLFQPSPLFQKIEASLIAELKEKFAGKPEQKAPKKQADKSTPAAVNLTPASQEEIDRLTKAVADQKQADKSTPAAVNLTPASQEEIDRLTKAVADQGDKVREMKKAKAEPAKVAEEVATLLQLKKDLSLAQGLDPNAKVNGDAGKDKKKAGGGNKGGKGADQGTGKKDNQAKQQKQQGKTTKVAAGGGDIDQALVERLTKAVSEQGDKVRQVKAAKAEKSTIDAEVASLLQLKRELAVAQGLDPEVVVGGGGKKNKKK